MTTTDLHIVIDMTAVWFGHKILKMLLVTSILFGWFVLVEVRHSRQPTLMQSFYCHGMAASVDDGPNDCRNIFSACVSFYNPHELGYMITQRTGWRGRGWAKEETWHLFYRQTAVCCPASRKHTSAVFFICRKVQTERRLTDLKELNIKEIFCSF